LEVLVDFFLFIAVLFRALLSLPVTYYLIEIPLAVREWEREGMGMGMGREWG